MKTFHTYITEAGDGKKDYPCYRCNGEGTIRAFANVLGGVCFKCGGSGRQRNKPSVGVKWGILSNVNGKIRHAYWIKAKDQETALRIARNTIAKASPDFKARHNNLVDATAVPENEVTHEMIFGESVDTFGRFLIEHITDSELQQLERFFDQLFAALNVDVHFTKHFKERVNDSRNGRPITTSELKRLFSETMARYGKKIHDMNPNAEAVIKDLQTQLNLPFIVKYDRANGEIDLVAKTIMRKGNFMTSSPILPLR